MVNEYSGTLEEYFETGYEYIGLILHDDRGLGDLIPDRTDGARFHSLKWTFFLKHNDKLEVYNEDGSVKYSTVLTKNREAMAKCNYSVSFIPNEINPSDWVDLFRSENVRAKLWREGE